MNIQHDEVIGIIAEAAERHILPLWRNLEQDQIFDKGAGDLVTAADRACEASLTRALAGLLARSLVVGEEAVAADPSTLGALQSERPVWVIDPLDGTRNFAHHRRPFAVMVALLRKGETLAGWIYDPLEQSVLSAERGAGSWLDGSRVTLADAAKSTEQMVGAVMTGYLPGDLRHYVRERREAFADWVSSRCAANEYRRLVTGDIDFLLYHRTLVWDHAPGILIAGEAGAWIRRYDGTAYSPLDDRRGLLCATSAENWARVREALLPADV